VSVSSTDRASGGGSGRLGGRVAIVTGGGRGIGRGVSLRLADEGAKVVVATRTPERGEEVADEVAQRGGKALAIACDVANEDQVREMVDRAVEWGGTVQVLVNNAQGFGGGRRSNSRHTIEDYPEDEWMEIMRSGLFGTWYCCRAVFPHMKAQGYGKIINFGSNNGIYGEPLKVGYNTTKEAIRGFTKTVAREWGPHGIRANIVCPALESDAMLDARKKPNSATADPTVVPLGYFGQPERDGGGLVAFLASSDSDYLSGNTICLEGGWHFLP
jgi:NAD(P)-dependent dehydrogenase (short-subunit alcohol dehydrogenase family)